MPGLGDFCPPIEDLSATAMTDAYQATVPSDTLKEISGFMEGLGLMPTANLPGQNFSLFQTIDIIVSLQFVECQFSYI